MNKPKKIPEIDYATFLQRWKELQEDHPKLLLSLTYIFAIAPHELCKLKRKNIISGADEFGDYYELNNLRVYRNTEPEYYKEIDFVFNIFAEDEALASKNGKPLSEFSIYRTIMRNPCHLPPMSLRNLRLEHLNKGNLYKK